MGKIRVKTLGIEELEKQQTKEAKKRKEAKEVKKTAKAPGLKGGERVVAIGPTEEELAKEVEKVTPILRQPADQGSPRGLTPRGKKVSKAPRQHSKRYRKALSQIDRNKRYPLPEAVTLIKKIGSPPAGGFDGTVELHINTIEKGISGQVTLPHGTGKQVRVAIADLSAESRHPTGEGGSFDDLLKKIESGKIDFDVLIATPSAMSKLAKVAKILGPRGLMPNPKNGTITDNPKKLAESFTKGQINFRTESQAPIIHTVVGKVSFKEKDLEENIETFLKAVGPQKIRNITVKSTMSPGIKIDTSL